jgi:hypothetical protein
VLFTSYAKGDISVKYFKLASVVLAPSFFFQYGIQADFINTGVVTLVVTVFTGAFVVVALVVVTFVVTVVAA